MFKFFKLFSTGIGKLFGRPLGARESNQKPNDAKACYESLVGEVAVTETALRRTGFIEVNGKRYEAESATPTNIPAKRWVKITGVIFNNRLLVTLL